MSCSRPTWSGAINAHRRIEDLILGNRVAGLLDGLSNDEIEEMMKRPKPIGDLSTFSEDQKFANLYQLIQLMKTDGQVFKSEISFCEGIAERLGYKREVISELAAKIYSDPSITSDRKSLMARAHKFLK